MKLFVKFAAIVVLIVSMSCGNKSENISSVRVTDEHAVAGSAKASKANRSISANKDMKPVALSEAILQADKSGSYGRNSQLTQISQIQSRARVVIKTGELGFEVDKYDDCAVRLQKLMDDWGGFIASSATEIPYENVKAGVWVLRIPSEKFETAFAEIKKLGNKLERESVMGQDVTEEFYDLEARLRNKLLEEKQVQDILRRTGSISEILEVQRELSRIRGEIEQFEGRKKYLLDQTGLSTITVRFHEHYPVAVSSSGGFWATIGNGFSEGFYGFANVLGGTITFIIAGLPVFVLMVFGIWIFIKLIRKIRTAKTIRSDEKK